MRKETKMHIARGVLITDGILDIIIFTRTMSMIYEGFILYKGSVISGTSFKEIFEQNIGIPPFIAQILLAILAGAVFVSDYKRHFSKENEEDLE